MTAVRGSNSDAMLRAQVAATTRLLVMEGLLDYSGHVSARAPGRDAFFIQSGLEPRSDVTAESVLLVGFDGKVIEGDARPPVEIPIHIEIYKARPDVQCVLHSHASAILPFSISPNLKLRPVVNLSGFLKDPVPLFEARRVTERDASLTGKLQANHPTIARAIAEDLGQECVILLRGHGNVVVGQSIRWCVYRAIYTDINARAQQQAHAMGEPVVVMSAAELAMHSTEVFDVDRPWDYWVEQLPNA